MPLRQDGQRKISYLATLSQPAGAGVGEVSETSAPIPGALLVSDPWGPGFPLSPWNPVAVEVAVRSQCRDLGHFPAQTGLAGDFLP